MPCRVARCHAFRYSRGTAERRQAVRELSAQLYLRHLSAGALGKVVHDFQEFRQFEGGHLRLPETLDKLLVRQRGALTKDYASTYPFTEQRVWHSDDGGLGHLGQGDDEVLDLPWANVLAAPDNQVLHPANDREIAVLVHPP